MAKKPVGCLFPMCACIESKLGCAHEAYDMKASFRIPDAPLHQWSSDWWDNPRCNGDDYDESFGG